MIKDRIELALIRLKARAIQRKREWKDRGTATAWSRDLQKIADKRILDAYYTGNTEQWVDYFCTTFEYKHILYTRLNRYQLLGLIDEWEDNKLGQIKITFNR